MKNTQTLVTAALLGTALFGQQGAREAAVQQQIDRQVMGQDAGARPATRNDDPLERLVRALDQGSQYSGNPQLVGSPAHAYNELSRLGALANGPLLQHLESLGPFGLRSALDLLLMHPDARVHELLGRLLRSGDLSKQVIAARVLDRLPPETAKPLVAEAAQSSIAIVRACALTARAVAGAPAADVVRETKELVQKAEPGAVEEITGVLGATPAIAASAEARAFLLELAKQGNLLAFDRLAPAWLRMCTREQETALVELFGQLPAEGEIRARFIGMAFEVEQMQRWPELLRRGYWLLTDANNQQNLQRALNTMSMLRLDPDPEPLARLWQRSSASHNAIMGVIASGAHAKNHLVLLDRILADTHQHNSNDRQSALQTLERHAPEHLRVRVAAILEEPGVDRQVVEAIGRVADEKTVTLLVRALLDGKLRALDIPSTAIVSAPMIARLSGPSNLGDVLDLVAMKTDASLRNQYASLVITALQRWFAREHVAPALARLFEIESAVADVIRELSEPLVGSGEVPVLLALLDRSSHASRADGGAHVQLNKALPADPAREWAARQLARIGGAEAIEGARKLLTHADPAVAASALSALLAMPGVDRKDALARALRSQPSWRTLAVVVGQPESASDAELRGLVCAALLASDVAVSLHSLLAAMPAEARLAFALQLVDAARDGKKIDANGLVSALGVIGETRQSEHLARMSNLLGHRSSSVRVAAVNALARSYDRQAAYMIVPALKDEDQNVRAAAESALSRFEKYFEQEEKWKRVLGK